MIRRKLQDLSLCISYNVNFLHDKAHGSKSFRRQYAISEEIGRGGFGIVYKAERSDDGAPVAVKFVEHRHVRDWTTTCKQLVPTEICLLEMCRGTPGVVRLVDWFANSKGFLIVMERPEEFMDLFDLISVYGHLDEPIARSIFIQIVNSVCSLYADHGVLHRDVKDENVIVNMRTGEIVLVDFGAATLITKTNLREFQGTRSYCPPEWFKRARYMPMEATVWSLGIVLYVMVTGSLPFRNEIQICLGRLSIPKRISADLENLLRRCLVVTPERRVNLIELHEHKWLLQPITAHSEPFKCVLDRKLSKKIGKKRVLLRGASSSALSDDTERLSDSQTDASVDPCERVRRASSTDVIIDVDREITPMAPRSGLDRNDMDIDPKFRCFSNYDNVSVDTPTEILHLLGYERLREDAGNFKNNRLSSDTDQLSRDLSSSQYYSAHEWLGMCSDSSAHSALGCAIPEDESRYFDTDSLRDATVLDYDDNASTSAMISQSSPDYSANPFDTNTNHIIYDNPMYVPVAAKNAKNAKNARREVEDGNRTAGLIDRGKSPSLSRHRPLTVQRSDEDNANSSTIAGLHIYRVDSKKYPAIVNGKQQTSKCFTANHRTSHSYRPNAVLS